MEEVKQKQNEELFQERYNHKKEKYDRIKETEYDIDDELVQAKERLHENIAQRIKYFEEKDELMNREIQELKDLKEPGKLDEEELLVEEYVINEIYEKILEKEEDKRKNKGKGKETRTPPIKLELEKDDEYNEESAIKIEKTLEGTLEKITDEIDKNREMEKKKI